MAFIRNKGLQTISAAIAFQVYFALSSIVITISLSRTLGAEDFGRYAWLVSIASLLSGLAQAGGKNLVVRETSRSAGRKVPLKVLGRTALISLGALLSLIALSLVFNGERITPDLLFSLGLLAVGDLALVLISASNRGIGQLQAGQIAELVLRPSLFLLLIGGAFLMARARGHSFDSDAMVYLLALAYAAATLVAAIMLFRGIASRPDVQGETAEMDWLGSFFRLGLIGWLAVSNAQLLTIFTGALTGYTQAGLFRVAAQAVIIMSLGLTAIATVQAPSYARAWKEHDMYQMHNLLQHSCRIGMAISAAAMIFLLLLGRPLLEFLFGEAFSAAFLPLCVLAGGQLLNGITGNVGVLMIAAKQERKLIIGNVAALATTLLAAWLLIPQYGALAAAGAAALGLALRNLLNLWFCYQTLGLVSLPFAPFLVNRQSQNRRDMS